MAVSNARAVVNSVLLFAVLGVSASQSQAQQIDTDGMELTLPSWNAIFRKNGKIRTSRLGIGEAFHFADPISNGRSVDPTVMDRKIVKVDGGGQRMRVSPYRITQTTVKAANDLGNLYLIADVTPSATRATYIAADVLTKNRPHNVVYQFELAQQRYEVVERPGRDQLAGSRTVGDLRAYVTFRSGMPKYLLVKRYTQRTADNAIWATIAKAKFDGANCANDGDNIIACVQSTPNGGAVRSKAMGKNSKGKRVKLPQTDLRIELGLEVDELSSVSVGWDTLIVRSRHDIAVMELSNGVQGTGSFGTTDPGDPRTNLTDQTPN